MGPYLYFRVLIFTVLASFTQRMSIQSACIQQWFRFKLLANFDFYLCLRINFHTSSFWVLILAASGPYWVLISQKNGSLSQSLGVLISLGGSVFGISDNSLFQPCCPSRRNDHTSCFQLMPSEQYVASVA